MPGKVMYDETGTGRHAVMARVEIGVLGVAGYGKGRSEALAELRHNLRTHLSATEAALLAVEADALEAGASARRAGVTETLVR